MNPIAQWNAELRQAHTDMEMKRKWKIRLERIDADLERERRAAEESLVTLRKEQEDTERLAVSSFSHFWFGLIGKLDERLATEERELAEAKLKHDAAQASLLLLEKERAETVRKLSEVGHAEAKLVELRTAKEVWIRDHDDDKREKLAALSDQIGKSEARLAEIKEADRAGVSARDALMRAADRLDSAKNWGTYDMLGGGMISTMVKHGRIDEARDHIHEAQHHLRRFAEELKDLNLASGAADGKGKV